MVGTPARSAAPRVRALTFHERAGAAQGARQAPHRGTRTSSTRCRCAPAPPSATRMVDIDGGIGTLFCFASKGTRELPNDTVVLDGAPRAARPRRHLRRPARLHLAPGRRGADQRLQLPGLGHAREARAGLPRRAADASSSRPARRRTSPSSSSAGSSSPASCPRARCSCCRGSAGGLLDELDRAGLGRVHRLRAHRRAPAHPHQRAPRRRHASASRPTRSTARSSART